MSSESKIAAILNPGRMLADGVPYPDFIDATRRLEAGEDWFDLWMDRSRSYEELGDLAVAAGDTISGGEWLWHASLSAHYAQFMWFHDPVRREAGQCAKADLYRRAAPHFLPTAEAVNIPFDGITIPGYLRRPPQVDGQAPCVLLIGGLESTKEESYLFEAMCLRRGMATFAFDGPGQGELFFGRKLQPDFERYVSRVIDHLEEVDGIDSSRLGVLGRSLGGYYAVRAAACDPRLKACLAWGACFDMTDFDAMPPHTRDGFVYVTGISDPAEARTYLHDAIDLADVAGSLRCPTYVLHGHHDVIFSMAQVDKLREQVTSAPLQIEVEPDGDHCCHNMGPVVRPRMADWIFHAINGKPEKR
ncbi:MAG: 2,6-dihydropseudooxynicotine hydrolase [Nitrospira sp.]|nr:2,6-dihydropseudooxynicotine hydrolase [Nitrospira sp.]